MALSSRNLSTNYVIDYISKIRAKAKFKDAREHAYRAALQDLLESFEKNINAINDAARKKVGAPDFVVYRGKVPIGYLEAKDLDKSLDKEEKSEQLLGYHSLGNIILTNYIEFRWYVNGSHRSTVTIGRLLSNKLEIDNNCESELLTLLTSFLNAQVPTIKGAQELAERLARTTCIIRDLIVRAMDVQDEKGWLHRWHQAFKEVLISDITASEFADMFAQTIAYGFFAAKFHNQDSSQFSRFTAASVLPKTNPFLRKLFSEFAGVDMPEEISWAVDEIVEILNRTDLKAVLADFSKQEGREDPIIHFYETFLTHYDPKLKFERGVFYTPRPIVNFIVNAVDEVLRDKFEREDGVADENSMILDPATGTGSFLDAVIQHKSHQKFNTSGMWSEYVSESLMKRLYGFELLMAPYAIAHLKIGLELKKAGYNFASKNRLGVFLTNTLDMTIKKTDQLFAEWISEESASASEVKEQHPIMVVLGNPPYSVSSRNKSAHIEKLMNTYKEAVRGEKNLQPLSDDYIKFIRFSQDRIEKTGYGIVAMITNNSFLSGKVHKGMREELMKNFNELYILNLHGSARVKSEENGVHDENVFDIMQGVSISILVKLPEKKEEKAKVFYSEMLGSRAEKYKLLETKSFSDIKWKELKVDPEYKFFIPKDFSGRSVYDSYVSLTNIFQLYSTGVGTGRDSVFVDFSDERLREIGKNLGDKRKTNSEIFSAYPLKDTASWNISNRRKDFQYDDKKVVEYAYRPFDNRWVIYDPIIRRDQRKVLANMLKTNLSLIVCQQNSSGKFNHAFCTDKLSDESLVSNRTTERGFVFPTYLHSEVLGQAEQNLNLKPEFLSWFSSKYGVNIANGEAEKGEIDAFELQGYIYACLNAKWFRDTFSEFHKIDFPKIPFVDSLATFKKISKAGCTLIDTQVGKLKFESKCSYVGSGDNIIQKCSFDPKRKMLWFNTDQAIQGVDAEVWDYEIGSYQVLDKWLKDRRGLELKLKEKKELIQIIERISKSLNVIDSINSLVSASTFRSVFKFSHSDLKNKTSAQAVSVDIPKKGFNHILELRLALACKIMDEMSGTKEFSRVKFAKAFYLADVVSGVDLKTEYVREAAGPLDQRALYNEKVGIEPLAAKNGFFVAEKKRGSEFDFVQYSRGSKLLAGVAMFDKLFGKSADKVREIIVLTSPMTRDQIEIVSTLYACWNDLLIAKKKPTDQELVKEFKNKWHPEKSKKFIGDKNKKPRFTEKQLVDAIAWMKSKSLIPKGSGKKTKSKPVKENDIPF